MATFRTGLRTMLDASVFLSFPGSKTSWMPKYVLVGCRETGHEGQWSNHQKSLKTAQSEVDCAGRQTLTKAGDNERMKKRYPYLLLRSDYIFTNQNPTYT